MKLLAGNSNKSLAGAIADYLDSPLTRAQVRRFADNEVFATIDENVRGEDVFVIQSDHRGDALFRLRAAGSEDGRAHAHLRQAGGQPDHPRGR
jgi:phosphoribosylpyrophosphate synthetase